MRPLFEDALAVGRRSRGEPAEAAAQGDAGEARVEDGEKGAQALAVLPVGQLCNQPLDALECACRERTGGVELMGIVATDNRRQQRVADRFENGALVCGKFG